MALIGVSKNGDASIEVIILWGIRGWMQYCKPPLFILRDHQMFCQYIIFCLRCLSPHQTARRIERETEGRMVGFQPLWGSKERCRAQQTCFFAGLLKHRKRFLCIFYGWRKIEEMQPHFLFEFVILFSIKQLLIFVTIFSEAFT